MRASALALALVPFSQGAHAGADAGARDAQLRTALHCAVAAQQHETAQLLLHKGARAGAKDAEGRTPLHLARALERGRGDAKLVSMLEYANQMQAPDSHVEW